MPPQHTTRPFVRLRYCVICDSRTVGLLWIVRNCIRKKKTCVASGWKNHCTAAAYAGLICIYCGWLAGWLANTYESLSLDAIFQSNQNHHMAIGVAFLKSESVCVCVYYALCQIVLIALHRVKKKVHLIFIVTSPITIRCEWGNVFFPVRFHPHKNLSYFQTCKKS